MREHEYTRIDFTASVTGDHRRVHLVRVLDNDREREIGRRGQRDMQIGGKGEMKETTVAWRSRIAIKSRGRPEIENLRCFTRLRAMC